MAESIPGRTDREFLAAIAREHAVLIAQRAADQRAHAAQAGIARRVAIVIVVGRLTLAAQSCAC
jgi:hypothetical protein